jgi:hypothetical protein
METRMNTLTATDVLYGDARQFTGVPFGQHSHYAQPWKAAPQTTPVAVFLNAIGMNYSSNTNWDSVSSIVKNVRIEMSWANINWDDTLNPQDFVARLTACKKYGIRPLILLNAHHGVPGPLKYSSLTLAAPLNVGDTTLTVTDASAVVLGHTGMSNIGDYLAMFPVFTARAGNVLTLSVPSPIAYGNGTQITTDQLKYLPFTTQGSDEYNATITGWKKYVLTVATFVRATLETVGKEDGGFDMECWNELTFGSNFLNAANYGLPAGPDMTNALIAATSEVFVDNPAVFAGVGLGDGFSNTTPWPGASYMPSAVTAIDKHPYYGQKSYTNPDMSGSNLNQSYAHDTWAPTYTENFPEYYGTLIQTETVLRDSGSIIDSSFSYAGIHGRFAQAGKTIPVWITEYQYQPASVTGAPDEVAKAILRFFSFWPAQGVDKLQYFNADNLLGEPKALAGLLRIIVAMSAGRDDKAAERYLFIEDVADTHNNVQWAGDATHNPLYDRDVFAFLPYQVNAHRWIVLYYVMSRDCSKDLPAENFTVTLQGVTGQSVQVLSTDALTGEYVTVGVRQRGTDGTLTLDLPTTDGVRILTIDDAGL